LFVATGSCDYLRAWLAAPGIQAQAAGDQVKMPIRVAIVDAVVKTVQRLAKCAYYKHGGRHREPLLREHHQLVDGVALAEKMSADIGCQYLELLQFGVGLQKLIDFAF